MKDIVTTIEEALLTKSNIERAREANKHAGGVGEGGNYLYDDEWNPDDYDVARHFEYYEDDEAVDLIKREGKHYKLRGDFIFWYKVWLLLANFGGMPKKTMMRILGLPETNNVQSIAHMKRQGIIRSQKGKIYANPVEKWKLYEK